MSYLSTSLQIVQIEDHKIWSVPDSGIEKRLGNAHAVCDVVRASGPSVAHGGLALLALVAAAARQLALAASARDRVGQRGRRQRVHERRLSETGLGQSTEQIRPIDRAAVPAAILELRLAFVECQLGGRVNRFGEAEILLAESFLHACPADQAAAHVPIQHV